MDSQTRILVIVIVLLFSTLVGVGAALLTKADKKSLPSAILYGGGAFAGAVTLLLLILSFGAG